MCYRCWYGSGSSPGNGKSGFPAPQLLCHIHPPHGPAEASVWAVCLVPAIPQNKGERMSAVQCKQVTKQIRAPLSLFDTLSLSVSLCFSVSLLFSVCLYFSVALSLCLFVSLFFASSPCFSHLLSFPFTWLFSYFLHKALPGHHINCNLNNSFHWTGFPNTSERDDTVNSRESAIVPFFPSFPSSLPSSFSPLFFALSLFLFLSYFLHLFLFLVCKLTN